MRLALPDPGRTIRLDAVSWRVATERSDLLATIGRIARRNLLPRQGLTVIKNTRNVFWGRLRDDTDDWFFKIRRARRPSFLGTSPIRREWQKSWWIRDLGLLVPLPLAVGELRQGGLLRKSLWVSRWIPEAPPLRHYLKRKRVGLSSRGFDRLTRRLAFQLGRQTGLLHAAGCFHRQYSAMNICIRESSGGPQPILIDFHHLTIKRRLTLADRVFSFELVAWFLRIPFSNAGTSRRILMEYAKGYCETGGLAACKPRQVLRLLPRTVPNAKPQRRLSMGAPVRALLSHGWPRLRPGSIPEPPRSPR